MKKLKLSIFVVGLMLGLVSLPGFAVELNSGNITQAPFDCAVDAMGCNLSNLNITGIAVNTFVHHSGLTNLYIHNNQISSIESGDFNGLSGLAYLYLYDNEICTIEEGSFDEFINLLYFTIWGNYLERANLGSGVLGFLDINDSDWEDSQTTGMCNTYNTGDYFDVVLTPENQNAISGTMVSFDVTVANNTGFDVFLMQDLPSQILYNNASVTPINNPALIMGTETNPCWLLSSGQTLNVQIDGLVAASAFSQLDVLSSIVDINDFSLVYTSAIAMVESIPDVMIEKTLIGDEPQMSGDTVVYEVLISNIGSDVVTGIDFVDVWPDAVLTFPNQASVNGVMQIPTIYNNLANNYLFDIGDLLPGAVVTVILTGTMDSTFPAGQEFINTAFVLVNELQYDTGNDAVSITNNVMGISDAYVTVDQISENPTMIGDSVVYSILYGNIGNGTATGIVLQNIMPNELLFDSASIEPSSEVYGVLDWDLGFLNAGETGEIILTGILLGGAQVGDVFLDRVNISTLDFELNILNNNDSITGEVLAVSDLSMMMYASNLTDPSRNINTGSNILAISGDVVLLEIMLDNGGNTMETGVLSVSNINKFVGYDGLTSWDIVISPQTNQNISLTGLVGPQNFLSFVPTANLNHNGILITDSIIIDEPLSCGDGLITQTEMCDTLGQIGDMLPGQYCEDIAGMCTIVTDGILNIVHMEYVTSLFGTGGLSASVLVDYEYTPSDLQCNDLTSDYGVVIVYEDNQGSMEFTCDAVNGVAAEEIRIDCDNGDIGRGVDTNSFVYECNYEYDEDGGDDDNIYNVQCFVNNTTNDNCEKSIAVGEGFYGVCGDGRLDDGERCDLGGNYNDEKDIDDYLDLDEEYDADEYGNGDYYCKNCRIKKDDTPGFVYQTPPCLMVNTTISIMEDEKMPFWWRLWDRDNLKIRNDYVCHNVDEDETRTYIDRDSMKCNFAIYNGKDYQQEDDEAIGELNNVDCFETEDGLMFEYFEDIYNVDFDNVAGRIIRDVTNLTDNIEYYGEYKLVLKDVEYEYCNPETQEWEDGRLYEGVCEVNFALTKPYIMQISTLGLDPTATNSVDFLKDFYDMEGNDLIEKTDINETMEVDPDDYSFDSSVVSEMQGFEDKYKSLSIEVNGNFDLGDNRTISSLFGGAEVRKVPNKLIFFVEGIGTLTLKQLTEYFPGTPFTIYVKGMDVKVEGDVMTNGMIITDQQIFFEDEEDDDGYCDEGGQTVQGIFVAEGGFDSLVTLRNHEEDDKRCQWGNLQVKGVLVGGGLDTLMEKKRSHLNDWFQVDSNSSAAIKRERKNEIFEGASVLIEYSPALWSHLPPGAELFTESLDVYKR